MKKILIVIPSYNEAKIIKNVISDIRKNFENQKLLVVDAYSNDGTLKIVQSENVDYCLVDKTYGISLAIELGILEAYHKNYDYLVRLDSDGQHPAEDVRNILEFAVKNNIDLSIGSRFLNKADYETNKIRLLGISILKYLIKIFYNLEITDCTSGCQIFSKRLLRKFVEDKNFEYSEIGAICKTKKLGYTIKEMFINMRPRKTGTSSFNFVNSFKYMLKNLLAIITSASFNLKK